MIKDEEFQSIQNVVTGFVKIKCELDDVAAKGDMTPEIARNLSIKYWSLSSSLTQMILSVDNLFRKYKYQLKKKYAEIMLTSSEKTEAGKKRQIETDKTYLELSAYVDSIFDYRAYLLRLKDDIDSAQRLHKVIYQKEVELFLGTPPTEE